MCGIVGLLDPAGARDNAALAAVCRAMADRLRHRGPDDGGEWTDAAAGIGVGHRRLSILDRSPGGRQPMLSASGRLVINYNGEIYNFVDLRRALEARGVQFRSQCDTEVLLEAIAIWGLEEALRQANGMFALALWDREQRVLWLAPDRMGQKPLYYGWAGGAFAFASELKAFDAVPGAQRNVDRDALSLFMRHGYVPEPWSVWKECRKLPPGHVLKIAPEDVLALEPDGVFLSNGPGDPAPCTYAIEAVRACLARKVPLFGICLGHQLLALAVGARTMKMANGHHGANHPVQHLESGRVMITSQNHGFAVDEASLPANARVTHRSLFDGTNQGIELADAPAFSFQGHPEAYPGPHDVAPLFDRFMAMIDSNQEGSRA